MVQGVYSNKEAVDDELVQLIYEPSCDEGALDAFISILTGAQLRAERAAAPNWPPAKGLQPLAGIGHHAPLPTPTCARSRRPACRPRLPAGPPGPRPDVLLSTGRISQPLLVLWGDTDSFTPADGPVGRFFQSLPETRANTRFSFLPSVGHCPHDDRPDLVHGELLPWLASVHKGQ